MFSGRWMFFTSARKYIMSETQLQVPEALFWRWGNMYEVGLFHCNSLKISYKIHVSLSFKAMSTYMTLKCRSSDISLGWWALLFVILFAFIPVYTAIFRRPFCFPLLPKTSYGYSLFPAPIFILIPQLYKYTHLLSREWSITMDSQKIRNERVISYYLMNEDDP